MEKQITWEEKLNQWSKGSDLPAYPKNITKRFLWRTSKISRDASSIFQEEFTMDDTLPDTQDYTPYKEYLQQQQQTDLVTDFVSPSGTRLVVPIPSRGKNFATIKDFIDNATIEQQKALWKRVATCARNMIKNLAPGKHIWIYTHGLGVRYLHVRIETNPTYYQNSELRY